MSRSIFKLPARFRKSCVVVPKAQFHGTAARSKAADTQIDNSQDLPLQDTTRLDNANKVGVIVRSTPKAKPSKRRKREDQKMRAKQRQIDAKVSPEPIHLPGPAGTRRYSPTFLRDACSCSQCIDPSTRQKSFQTTDIPQSITARKIEHSDGPEWHIKWENDVDGYGTEHVTTITNSMLASFDLKRSREDPSLVQAFGHEPWTRRKIRQNLQFFDFHDYMTDDKTVLRALLQLRSQGLLLVRNVPGRETSVEDIAGRIGNIRDTFYGRTWDVKSVPSAKNVAYTSKNLGLHMDLLYVDNPPGLQLLHCLKNSCEGGRSIFSDGLQAASRLSPPKFSQLRSEAIPYHYFNDGQDYYKKRYLLADSEGRPARSLENLTFINWSPPFQGVFEYTYPFTHFMNALRQFAKNLEGKKNVLDYQLQEGECVIFNNRRVLHGRRQFDTSSGERWLKGTYVDTDVFESRLRALAREQSNLTVDEISTAAQYVFGDLGKAGEA